MVEINIIKAHKGNRPAALKGSTMQRMTYKEYKPRYEGDTWEQYLDEYNAWWKVEHAKSLRVERIKAWYAGEYLRGNAILELIGVEPFNPKQVNILNDERVEISQTGAKYANRDRRAMMKLQAQVWLSMLCVTSENATV